VADFDSVYLKHYVMDTKPLVVDGKFRWDRATQIIISPKLQYYLHNFTAFSWPVIAFLQGQDPDVNTSTNAVLCLVKFIVSIFVYYLIIRRMCASVRDQMEHEPDNGDRLKES
jgi:hypothetical protein